MDCSKAWNLMMKSFDQESSIVAEDQLREHLALCDACRTQYGVLANAFSEIKEFNDFAPDNVEIRVMSKLKAFKQKEKTPLPFVTVPLLMFLLILSCRLYQVVRMSPMAIVDQVSKVLTATYSISQALLTVIHYFFRIYPMRQAITVLFIVGMAYGFYSFVINYRRARNRFNWRISR